VNKSGRLSVVELVTKKKEKRITHKILVGQTLGI
jgi:hypothetical protein